MSSVPEPSSIDFSDSKSCLLLLNGSYPSLPLLLSRIVIRMRSPIDVLSFTDSDGTKSDEALAVWKISSFDATSTLGSVSESSLRVVLVAPGFFLAPLAASVASRY